MAISINPTLPVIAAQGAGSATDGVVLQPGTVISAQVQNVAADNLVRIAIAGLSFDVLSEVALTPGQNLQLAVSQAQNGVVRLQVLGQGGAATSGETASLAPNLAPSAPVGPAANAATAADPLTPLERIAVSVASENAASTQQSLAPLFANLGAAASSNNLPPVLQQAIAQVLAQQTSLDGDLSGGDIQNAFQKSGLFLEASLASDTSASGSAPDLKAALIVLRQTLASAVETTESPAAIVPPAASAAATATKPSVESPALVPAQLAEAAEAEVLLSQPALPSQPGLANAAAGDATKLLLAQALLSAEPKSVTSGAALNLLQEALQEIPHAANATAIITSSGARAAPPNPPANTPPPPFRGALPSAQPVANATIAPDAPLPTTVHHLLDDTDAAIARQTLLQVASLPDRADPNGNRIDPSIPRWNFEIPFATPQGTAMAQFEISRDGGGREVEAAKRTWQARFSLNIEPAGPVHAQISLTGERTSVRMWAERPQTAAQLRATSAELTQALSRAELTPGDIVIREGAPPQPSPAKAGHFLDRAL
jgi:Flagellar hook-length control protein FliK